MELTHVATPPDAMLERAVRAAPGELLWLGAEPFAIRCEPRRATGLLKIIAVAEGEGVIAQGGHQAILREGTFAWLQSDAPFELAMSRGRRLLLRLPLSAVQQRHPGVDLWTAVTRGEEHAGERIVAGLLRQILCESSSLSERDCIAAVGVVLEAIGMCGRAPELPRARVERALADIELRLGDPALQPTDIARAQGVSRRYLDGAMAEQLGSSLAAHIRRRRLERAASELSTRPDDAVSEVAARWGFRDASHFTRLFRGHFATTPAAYRRAALDGTRAGGGGRADDTASRPRVSSATE
ncbi:helix-turn-helix transcriptional regulator [Sorangium sp. So ce136]|uniref:AraC family transcriptional regulator n=1 Tax=Sorangium sp. So ce136 TaxID=3133284 RepID=UPI003F0B3742